MPLYEFSCACGYTWNALFSLERYEEAKAGQPCPECGEMAQKLVSSGTNFTVKGFSLDNRRKNVDARKQRQKARVEKKVADGEMTNDQMWAMAAAGKRSKVSPYLMDPKKDGKDQRPEAQEKRERSTGHFHDEIEM